MAFILKIESGVIFIRPVFYRESLKLRISIIFTDLDGNVLII